MYSMMTNEINVKGWAVKHVELKISKLSPILRILHCRQKRMGMAHQTILGLDLFIFLFIVLLPRVRIVVISKSKFQ